MKKLVLMTVAAIVLLVIATPVFAGKGGEGEDHKITICHIPPGNPDNAHSITVDKKAWKNGHNPHNKHSLDYIGACRRVDPTPTRVVSTPTIIPSTTPVDPTDTPVPTETEVIPTIVPEPSPTVLVVPSATMEPTSVPTQSNTPVPEPTVAPTDGPKATETGVPSNTRTPIATDTPLATSTGEPTIVPVFSSEVETECTCNLYYTVAGDDDDRLQFVLIGVIALVNILHLLKRVRRGS